MATSVRLPPKAEQSLASYCAQVGVSKSRVLQEALAQYLMHPAHAGLGGAAKQSAPQQASAVFQAFAAACLIGHDANASGRGGRSADKSVVRAAARQRLQATV